jgi:hypothetical protein
MLKYIKSVIQSIIEKLPKPIEPIDLYLMNKNIQSVSDVDFWINEYDKKLMADWY